MLLMEWSWRDSNPRPHSKTICFLHAYSSLGFSSVGKTWTTNRRLIPVKFRLPARGYQEAISDNPAPLSQAVSENERLSDVSSHHLVTG